MLSLYIQPADNFLKSSAQEDPEPDTVVSDRPIPRNPRDPMAFLYYSIVLTSLTVIVAIVVGVLQLLTMISNAAEPTGKFWDGVEIAGEYYDVIGGAICGCFLIFGGISVVVYPYWRRWVEKGKAVPAREEIQADEGHQEYIDEDGQTGGVVKVTPLPTANYAGTSKTGTSTDTKTV